MKITIEVPDTVKECEGHRYPSDTMTCTCGLPAELAPYIKSKKKEECED